MTRWLVKTKQREPAEAQKKSCRQFNLTVPLFYVARRPRPAAHLRCTLSKPVTPRDGMGTLPPYALSKNGGTEPHGIVYPKGRCSPPKEVILHRACQKMPLRRKTGARRRTSCGIPSETSVPASFSRRRALLVRNPVGNPGPGVISSPEGAFLRVNRTKVVFRRHFLAGGRVLARGRTGPQSR